MAYALRQQHEYIIIIKLCKCIDHDTFILYELTFLCGLEKNVERAKLHMMHIVLHEELNIYIGKKLMVGLDVLLSGANMPVANWSKPERAPH